MKHIFSGLKQYRLYLLIYIFLISVIVGIDLIIIRTVKQSLLHNASERLSSIVNYKTREITNWIREREGDVVVAIHTHNFPKELIFLLDHPGDIKAREGVLEHLTPLKNFYGYWDIQLVKPSGEILISLKSKSDIASPESSRNIREVFAGDSIKFSNFFYCSHCRTAHLDFYSTIYRKTGDTIPAGLVILRVDPNSYIYPLIQDWPVPSKTSETLIVTEDSGYVLFLNELRHKKNSALKLRLPANDTMLPAAMAIRGKEGTFNGIDYRGHEVLSVIKKIPGTSWFMIGKTDFHELLEPLVPWRIYSSLASLFIIIAIGLTILMIILQQRRAHYKSLYEIESENLAKEKEVARVLRENQEALSKSEKSYRMLFTSMMEGFALHEVIYDEKGNMVNYKFIDVNQTFEEMTGLKASRILGKSITEVLPNIEQEWFDRYFGVVRTGKPLVFELYNKDLDKFFRVHAFRPELHQFANTFEDITESRRIQEEIRKLNTELEERVRQRTKQLEESNRELESFSYSVSHDLRAPLRTLDGFSQALLEDCEEKLDERGRHYLKRIRLASQRMAVLIDDLLKLSRVARQTLNLETIDLSAMVRNICDEFRNEKKGESVSFRIQQGVLVNGDSHLLRIALTNLIGNAVKFSGRKARQEITFGVTEIDHKNAIFIQDNGTGFNMKYTDKLFDPFQRLHTNEEFPGTGIGLTIVQRIVHRHGGKIWAESAPEMGATFYFTLPSIIA